MDASSVKDQRRLYGDLAWTWPIISPPENYIEETEQVCQIIREHAQISVKTLLNLGCGGGHNDHTLKRHVEVTGVDLSETMLGLARRLNPEVAYHVGDMRSVRLGQTFDAVTIFDSLAYMLTEDDLRAAFTTTFIHLKPGGVFLTYQENDPNHFEQNRTRHSAHALGDVEIVLIENTYDPDPADTTFEATFVYLIRRGGRLEVEIDRHLCGIFPTETLLILLKETGFDLKSLDESVAEGCTMFVGVKPL